MFLIFKFLFNDLELEKFYSSSSLENYLFEFMFKFAGQFQTVSFDRTGN